MSMKHMFKMSLVAVLFGCLLGGTASFADVKFDGKNWRLYPPDASNQASFNLAADEEMELAVVDNPGFEDLSVYTHQRVSGLKSYVFEFRYRVRDGFQYTEGNLPRVVLNFNKDGGGNGSAGSEVHPLPIGSPSEWLTFRVETQAPASSVNCQVVINLSDTGGRFQFTPLQMEKVLDGFPIRGGEGDSPAPLINGNLDDAVWGEAAPLTPFYRSTNKADPAVTQTTAHLSYDRQNIYIAFRNSEPFSDLIVREKQDRDSRVWKDDCNEVFISTPSGKTYQFIVNSIGTRWDGKLFTRVPGDPPQANSDWDGEWDAAAEIARDNWTSEFRIPFATLGEVPAPGDIWRINLTRQRKVTNELSQFNRSEGAFNTVDQFASLRFTEDGAKLTRFVEAVRENPYTVDRPSPKFRELLSGQIGDYVVYSWPKEMVFNKYSPKKQEKYTPESFAREQNAILNEFGEAGILGPMPLPWAAKADRIGMERIREFYREYKTKFWFTLYGSATLKKAVDEGATFYFGEHNVDPTDPAFQAVAEAAIHDYFASGVDYASFTGFFLGRDEPMNYTSRAYSLTRNQANTGALLKLDETIKKDYGFGRYGLHDKYAAEDDPRQSPFNKIAFMRWWHQTFADGLKTQRALLRQYAPDVPFHAYPINTVSAMSGIDVARLAGHTDYVSVDPYPTATRYNYGSDRAVFHTGFTVKMVRDMAGGKPTSGIVQNFPYWGGTPTLANLREWASQALKNGAEVIGWYCSNPGPVIRAELPDNYREMVRLSNIITDMNKLEVPSETNTAIFYSNPSRWAMDDGGQHSHYTLYSILGEKLKSWFRFVSDTGLEIGLDELTDYELLYVPHLKYVTAGTAERLLEFTRNGGVLVVFDPEALTWNIDGSSSEAFRRELIGPPPGSPRDAKSIKATGALKGLGEGTELPLTPLSHIAGAGEVAAFNIAPPADATVIATYSNGEPAAYERPVGQGKVVYFAVQPFGNARLGIDESPWDDFMRAMAEQAGEPLGLPIWDFLLPKEGGEIDINYVVEP